MTTAFHSLDVGCAAHALGLVDSPYFLIQTYFAQFHSTRAPIEFFSGRLAALSAHVKAHIVEAVMQRIETFARLAHQGGVNDVGIGGNGDALDRLRIANQIAAAV